MFAAISPSCIVSYLFYQLATSSALQVAEALHPKLTFEVFRDHHISLSRTLYLQQREIKPLVERLSDAIGLLKRCLKSLHRLGKNYTGSVKPLSQIHEPYLYPVPFLLPVSSSRSGSTSTSTSKLHWCHC